MVIDTESCDPIFIPVCLYFFTFYFDSNLSGAFTLAFSYFCGIEEITRGKVLGIMVCFAGAVCVALQDSSAVGGDGNNQQNHTISGDIVALMSAAGYGLYTSMIRYLVCQIDISRQIYQWWGYVAKVFLGVALSPT